jgi:hypothetical protein
MGLALGPFIGSILYEIGGFELPFYVLAGFFLLTGPIIRYSMSAEVDQITEHRVTPGPQITFMGLMSNTSILMALGMCFVSTFIFGVFDATLSLDLSKHHMSQFRIGLEFFITFIVYLISSLVLGS